MKIGMRSGRLTRIANWPCEVCGGYCSLVPALHIFYGLWGPCVRGRSQCRVANRLWLTTLHHLLVSGYWPRCSRAHLCSLPERLWAFGSECVLLLSRSVPVTAVTAVSVDKLQILWMALGTAVMRGAHCKPSVLLDTPGRESVPSSRSRPHTPSAHVRPGPHGRICSIATFTTVYAASCDAFYQHLNSRYWARGE